MQNKYKTIGFILSVAGMIINLASDELNKRNTLDELKKFAREEIKKQIKESLK